jgi:hypothetical protein
MFTASRFNLLAVVLPLAASVGCVMPAVAQAVRPLLAQDAAAAQDPGVDHDAEPDAAEQAGRSVRFMRERARLQAARRGVLEPLTRRSRALDSAMSVLALPAARPTEARTLGGQVEAIDQQIESLLDALTGAPSDDQRGKTRDQLEQEIQELRRTRMRAALLAQAHAADGRARVALLDRLRLEKQALTDRIERATDPYDRRVRWLNASLREHNDAFKQAMHRFGRIAELGTTSVQAVRVHTVNSEGRLQFSWTDARGSIVASAIVRLTAEPDPYHEPPFVHGRYPVLLQGRQETQILAGHFHIEFRVSIDALLGEARVLDAATKLLDIDALGRLVPRLGRGGLD